MSRDNGGPAFPIPRGPINEGHDSIGSSMPMYSPPKHVGMSLRDYFAAAALQGRLAAGMNEDADSSDFEAAICYQIADSMLAARAK